MPRRELKLKPWRPVEEPEFLLERIESARFLCEREVSTVLQRSDGIQSISTDPQRAVLVRSPAGVASSHCDIPGHGILD